MLTGEKILMHMRRAEHLAVAFMKWWSVVILGCPGRGYSSCFIISVCLFFKSGWVEGEADWCSSHCYLITHHRSCGLVLLRPLCWDRPPDFCFFLPEGLQVSACCFKLALSQNITFLLQTKPKTNIPRKRIIPLTLECQFSDASETAVKINCAASVALWLLIRKALKLPDCSAALYLSLLLLLAAYSLGCCNCFLMPLATIP